MWAHERHKKRTEPSRCDEAFAEDQREIDRSDLLLPEPHALEPGIGLLKAPAVIGFQNVGDGEHQIKGAAVVAAAGEGGALQGIGELQEIELRQPVALLQGSKGVVLLVGKDAEMRGAAALALKQRTEEGRDALKEEKQGSVGEAPKGSDTPRASQANPC